MSAKYINFDPKIKQCFHMFADAYQDTQIRHNLGDEENCIKTLILCYHVIYVYFYLSILLIPLYMYTVLLLKHYMHYHLLILELEVQNCAIRL